MIETTTAFVSYIDLNSRIKYYEQLGFYVHSVTPFKENDLLVVFRKDEQRAREYEEKEKERELLLEKQKKDKLEEERCEKAIEESMREGERIRAEMEERAVLLKAQKDLEEWNKYCQEAGKKK